jgi:nucleotide-binding universal stress UspA family protein
MSRKWYVGSLVRLCPFASAKCVAFAERNATLNSSQSALTYDESQFPQEQKVENMSWSPKKCIVVPVDFSAASDKAIQTALELVRSPSDVHVIHVVNVPDYIPYGEAVWVVEPTEWIAKAELHLKEYIESSSEFPNVTWATVNGEPDAGIVKYARDHHADLIVMPCHGLRGLKRLLMGSVTSGVLRNAPCEVLVQRFPA